MPVQGDTGGRKRVWLAGSGGGGFASIDTVEEREPRIGKAAYLRAARRGFVAGRVSRPIVPGDSGHRRAWLSIREEAIHNVKETEEEQRSEHEEEEDGEKGRSRKEKV